RIGRDHGDGDALLVEPGARPVGGGGGHGDEGEPRDAAVKPRGDRAADHAEPGERDLQGRYSTLMLASAMIFANLRISSRMCASNASGFMGVGSAPRARSRFFTSSSPRMRATSRLIFATTGLGVLDEVRRPNQGSNV